MSCLPAEGLDASWQLVQVIENGDEAAIVSEVEEHIRRSTDEVLRRLT